MNKCQACGNSQEMEGACEKCGAMTEVEVSTEASEDSSETPAVEADAGSQEEVM